MFPHFKETLYDLIRDIHLSSWPKDKIRPWYFFYWAYYIFWTILAFRLLIGSMALRYGILTYFTYDMTLNTLRKMASSSADFLLIFSIITPFPVVSHLVVYFSPDPLIWEHMFDVLVRNVDQFKRENAHLLIHFSWKLFYKRPLGLTMSLTRQLLDRFIGKSVKIKRKLKYFPHVRAHTRSQIIFIGWYFEVLSHSLYLSYISEILSRGGELARILLFNHQVALFTLNLFDCLTFWVFSLTFFQVALYNLNIVAQTTILSCVEYRYMNRYLASAVSMMKSRKKSRSDVEPLIYQSAFREYRSLHTSVTLFLLRTSKLILSPALLFYLFACLLASSYIILLLYFHHIEPYYRKILQGIIGLFILGGAVTLGGFVLVNLHILSSVPILYRFLIYFSRIGERKKVKCREGAPLLQGPSCTLFPSQWKVLVYYELLRNCHGKHLAISAGMYGAVRRKTILQLVSVYLAYFMAYTLAFREKLHQRDSLQI